MKTLSSSRKILVPASLFAGAFTLQASTDYGPAIWKPLCQANYYTSGYGHKFFVIHDMEGYYAYTCSWFTSCNPPSASVHFAVNGKKDATSDANPGEISQLGVRTAQYAWHATCWNQHSLGTEHEGFASNPAWYTEEMYQTSAACTKAMAEAFGFPKDRNHIVAHGEKSNSAWVAWAPGGLGINATCNTHTDPGPYWDWPHYMALISGNSAAVVGSSVPGTVSPGASFTASITMNNNGGTTWTADATPHNLGSQDPQDNTIWRSNRVPIPGNIAPGQNATFTFTCTAPTTPGSYTFSWQMVEDGVQWFGQKFTTTINVQYINNSSVVAMSYPTTVSPGQSFTASVTMNNNGSKVWNSDATPHNLGSQNPQDNSRWGTGRVGLPGGTPVNPGQNVTFTFNCTAPTTPGTYPFDWKMVEDGVEWFGAYASGSITVVNPEYIVDNASGGFSASANWSTGTGSTDKYGGDYRFRSTAALSDAATWTTTINATANHNVYAWWPQGANRSTTAPYIVAHSAGTTTVNKNQQINGGSWQLLGTFALNAGSNNVKLSCWTTTGYVVMADAVRWLQQ